VIEFCKGKQASIYRTLRVGNSLKKTSMIIPSFNMKGFWGNQKELSLKGLIQSLNLDVILIQETMCTGDKSTRILDPSIKKLVVQYN
jgi:hypothetical protein